MRKIILVTGLLTILTSFVFGQCPTAGFSMPDSVCGNVSFQITNTSTPGNSFAWDLCPGDLNLTPTGVNLGNVGPLNFPQQLRIIKDNGKFFMLIAETNANSLSRYDFGNSLDNLPVKYSYGNLGNVFSLPAGLDVIQENGIWYAIVVNYGNHNLIRVNLGASIEANVATATDLGSFGLNNCNGLKIGRDGLNYHVFLTSSQFTRIDFGSSITNTPSASTQIPIPTSTLGWGFDYSYDCIQNKYVGFYSENPQNKIYILDFGNSLANVPVVAGNVNTGSGPTGICLIREGADYHLLVSLGNAAGIQNFKIGNDLLAPPVSIYLNQIGGISVPYSINAYNDSSTVVAFVSCNYPTLISKISWPNNCSFSPAFSTDPAGISATSTGGGFQQVTLAATDASNLTSVYTDSVYVQPVPVSNFFAADGCEGVSVQFYDSSTISLDSITSWTWDFGDSSPLVQQQNPAHTFPGTGIYTVTLTTQSNPNCPGNSFSSDVTIHPLPSAALSFTNNQCQFTPVLFTDLSQAFGTGIVTNWLWDFGDTTMTDTTQNPSHIYQAPGIYVVTLTVTTNTGCIDSVSQSITILPAPVADFTTASTCVGETVAFTNTSSISGGGSLNYQWDFGDNTTSILESPTHLYALLAGNYDVQLIAQAANGCSDTILKNIRVANRPSPQFSWTPAVVCVGNQVSFTNTSTGNGGDTIALNQWNFGDSNQSTDLNPFHAYADTGIYIITLNVLSLTDCDSSITQQINVIPAPTASFTANPVCLNFTTSFNPSVTTPPGTVVDSIVWTFGDGNGFSGTTSPTYTYSAPGRYEVIMTVYNDLLCTGTFIDSVDIFPLPVAGFTTSLVCSEAATIFDGTSSQITNDSLSSWVWDFAGLGTGTDSVVSFTFQNPGTYNVTMIVYSTHGCSDTLQKPIEVIASPDFDFIFNEPCFGGTSSFTFIPNVTPAPSADLIWDFGDGTLSFLLNPSHVYTTIDTFFVNLTVTEDSSGCTSSKIKPLVINPLPNTGFEVNNVCEDIPVTVNDTSSVSSGSIVAWNWNLGVFGTSTVSDPVITPSDPGTYTLTLTVTTDKGCSATANGSIIVYTKPDAVVVSDPLYGSPPLTVNFINNTIGANTYFWDFGDGNTSTGIAPSHVYTDTGSYTTTMIATSIDGCLDTTSTVISVIVPYMDLEVADISYTQTNNQFKISALLINKGFITINSFQIKQRIDEGSIISEQWLGTLLPGSQLTYQFQSVYQTEPTFKPSYYCVEALNPNDTEDDNPVNNNKCNGISQVFEIFSVYPNPFNEQMTVDYNLNFDGLVDFEIYDMTGKLVLNIKAIEGLEGFNTITIPVNHISKGVFTVLVRFRDEENRKAAVKIY